MRLTALYRQGNWLCVWTLLLAGCGGGDDKEAPAMPAFSTHLEGSRTLGSLTAEENEQRCQAVDAWNVSIWSTYQEVGCHRRGLVFAQDLYMPTAEEMRAGCKMTYDACMAEPMPASTCMAIPPEAVPTCVATITDLETCVNAIHLALPVFEATLPACDALVVDDQNGDYSLDPPVSCVEVSRKCPIGTTL